MFINHFHTAPEGWFDENDSGKGTLKRLKKIMDEAGIEKAIAFAPFLYSMPKDKVWYNPDFKTERECNEWLYQSLKDYPNIYGFVTVNPKNSNACDILTEYINKDFVGVKIHPAIFEIRVDDPSLDEFYSTVERLNVPILFHIGVHGWKIDEYRPILLDNVAYKHPRLKIIMEHSQDPIFFKETLGVLTNNSKRWNNFPVYAGITSYGGITPYGGLGDTDRILLIRDSIGAERIIYGVDYPFNDLKEIRNGIRLVNTIFSQEESDLILGKNLERIIKR